MSIFLQKLAAEVILKYGDSLADLHVILPSSRATLYFEHYLKASARTSIFLPYTMTLDNFIKSLSNLESLNQPQLLFKLYEVFQSFDQNKDHTFEKFLPLGGTILAEFSLIDRNLTPLKTKQLFKHWLNDERLQVWGMDVEQFKHDGHLKIHLDFCEKLEQTYFAFKEQLLQDQKGYSGLIYRQVADNIVPYVLEKDIKQVIFAGFNQIYPAEDQIIETLIERQQAHIYWDVDRYYIRDRAQEAGRYFHFYFKKYHQTKPSEIAFLGNQITTKPKHIQIIKTATKIGQVQVANQILHTHLENLDLDEIKEDNNEIAILLADESLLLPLLSGIDTEFKGTDIANLVNITMGLALKYTPIYGFVQLVSQLQNRTTKIEGAVCFYYAYVYQLLRHPLIKGRADWQTLIEDFNLAHQQSNTLYFSEEVLNQAFEKEPVLAAFFKFWRQSPDLFECFKAFLLLVSKEDKGWETSSFYQTYLIIQQLENLYRQEPNFFTLKVLQYFLRHSLQSASVPFTSAPLQPIQIMGTLESRALDFKRIILLSCNEGILPHSKSLDHLIPFQIRQEYKLPTYIHNDSNFAYTFYRLFHQAEELALVYVDSQDTEKSRFLLQIEHELKKYKSIKISLKHFQQPVPSVESSLLEIEKDTAILGQLKSFLQIGLTPTAIITYLNNPIDFFERYILKIRDQEDRIEDIDQRLFGVIVHEVLKQIYTKGSISKAILQTWNLKKIETSINTSIAKYGEQMKLSGTNYLVLDIAKSMIKNFLEFESRHIVPCEILMVEEKLRTSFRVADLECALTGNLDRVDYWQNKIRIIDYKTGTGKKTYNCKNLEELFEKPDEKIIQLLLYKYLFLKQNPTTEKYLLQSGFYFLRQINNLHKEKPQIITYKLKDEPNNRTDFVAYVETFLNMVVEDMLDKQQVIKAR